MSHLYTYKEAGTLLGCSARTVRDRFARRRIVRDGHFHRITEQQLQAYILEKSKGKKA